MTVQTIPFIDLSAQRQRIGKAMDDAVLAVVNHGGYIMGPEVGMFEKALAEFAGAKHVISCANGTDALALVLMAKGVRPGDAVICPSFTFAATAEVVAWLGATPMFADIDARTFNLDPQSCQQAILDARALGLRPVAIIPVDMFGQPADYSAIEAIAEAEGLWIMSDAAQSVGARCGERVVGRMGLATATSFFPSKPLGCYGDGGAIFTDDDALAVILRSLRVHGQGSSKYDNVRIGMNGRLDTIQAAVLIQKLAIFPDEIEARNKVAALYHQKLAGIVETPFVAANNMSVWAQYTVKVAEGARDAIQASMAADGIPTQVYYPKPLSQQPAYMHYPRAGNGTPVSEKISQQVLSLPMHAYIDEATIDRVVAALAKALP